MNMAIDEILLRGAEKRGAPLFRVYQWKHPAISIGYFQDYPVDYEDDYAIVRRPTGGGLVWHGKDLTFTLVVPRNHDLYAMTASESYCAFHRRIMRALQSKGYVCSLQAEIEKTGSGACFESPVTHDLVIGGKKIAGGAQRRTKYGLLHQGSLLLPPSQIRMRPRAAELRQILRNGLGVRWEDAVLSKAEKEQADELHYSKYATDAWNKQRNHTD